MSHAPKATYSPSGYKLCFSLPHAHSIETEALRLVSHDGKAGTGAFIHGTFSVPSFLLRFIGGRSYFFVMSVNDQQGMIFHGLRMEKEPFTLKAFPS